MPVERALQEWIQTSLDSRWPGSEAGAVIALKGDASTRRFWRVLIEANGRGAPASVVVVDLGPEDLPQYAKALKLLAAPLAEPPYVNVQRFLRSVGVAVPEIYLATPKDRLLMVEDVGELSLLEATQRSPDRALELYKLAIDELLRIHVDANGRREASCIGFSIAYDERLFLWELEQFVSFGVGRIAPGANAAALRPELEMIAERLGRLERVFSHRDYHRENLFVQSSARSGIRVLDFQDALMAPAAQDLAVLLTTRDNASVITPALEAELLEYYLGGFEERTGQKVDRGRFHEGYRLCVLQHALKMIGRFIYIESTGKPGYTDYLPACAAQARRMLAELAGFPRLKPTLQAASA